MFDMGSLNIKMKNKDQLLLESLYDSIFIEKIIGNTGWVYHRTRTNPENTKLATHGIKLTNSYSAFYGRGLYCCYNLQDQLDPDMKENYGKYILKGKIDLNGFVILDEEIYKLSNPKGNFEQHLKEVGTNINELKNVYPFTFKITKNIWRSCKEKGYNGIIHHDSRKVAVIWNRRNFIPYQYSSDDAKTWNTFNPDIKSIKRPFEREWDTDDDMDEKIKKTRLRLSKKFDDMDEKIKKTRLRLSKKLNQIREE